MLYISFIFIDNSAPAIYTLSLHDALPISGMSTLPHVLIAIGGATLAGAAWAGIAGVLKATTGAHEVISTIIDRKSTRLNSSHMSISYAVFCLKKKMSKL